MDIYGKPQFLLTVIHTSMESLPLGCIQRFEPEVQWISGPGGKQDSRLTQYS